MSDTEDFSARLFDEPALMVDEMTQLGLKHIMFQAFCFPDRGHRVQFLVFQKDGPSKSAESGDPSVRIGWLSGDASFWGEASWNPDTSPGTSPKPCHFWSIQLRMQLGQQRWTPWLWAKTHTEALRTAKC